MRLLSLVSLALLTACAASEVQSRHLNDGSWSFTCELSMDECLRRAQEHCPNQRFRILEGTSETRLRDAPPFERAYHTSRLHLACNDGGANVLLSIDGSNQAVSKPVTICSAGETRACVGAGACKGGQACLPEGKGFGSCDCGSATPGGVPLAEPAPPGSSSAAPVPVGETLPAP